jgi:Ser/Thr protein kinase RdoA (MazF antagonist)
VKPFHDLTHRGQARRLRPHAARVLRAFGIGSARLRDLPAATNVVFRVDCEDGRRFALRMTSPRSAHSVEIVRSEIAWIRALAPEYLERVEARLRAFLSGQ